MTDEDRAIHLRNARRFGPYYWRYFNASPMWRYIANIGHRVMLCW